MSWAKDKDRIKANVKKLVEYKKKIKCDRCGVRDYRVIDFHHLKDKDGGVSAFAHQGYSWKRVLKEIDKCIPLCSNCHRIHHSEEVA